VDFVDEHDAPTPVRYPYHLIDCTRLTEFDLESKFARIRVSNEDLRIIYLDEVHRLSRRFMDERLLKPLEDFPAICIASSAYVKRDNDDKQSLDKMFQNRFTFRITTELPDFDQLVVWLAERCPEWGIRVEIPEVTLLRMAERCHQVPEMVLHVLNKAHKRRSKFLTQAMVEEHTFDFDE
jgi:hypothetical protein